MIISRSRVSIKYLCCLSSTTVGRMARDVTFGFWWRKRGWWWLDIGLCLVVLSQFVFVYFCFVFFICLVVFPHFIFLFEFCICTYICEFVFVYLWFGIFLVVLPHFIFLFVYLWICICICLVVFPQFVKSNEGPSPSHTGTAVDL